MQWIFGGGDKQPTPLDKLHNLYAKLVSLRGKEDQHREITIETIRQITEVLIQGDKARSPASRCHKPRVFYSREF